MALRKEILREAKGSLEIRAVLRKLFPETFKRQVNKKKPIFDIKKLSVKETNYLFTTQQAHDAGFSDNNFMQVRGGAGQFTAKAFYLDNNIDWELKKDDMGCLCLIPSPK